MAALFIPAWSSFFVVSGYVLYRPWAMAQARMALGDGVAPTKAPDGGVGTFWLRRILRVYPVYWVVQGVAMAISGTGDVQGPADWFQIITLFPLPDFNVIINHGLGVIVWTMVVELAYYTVLPFISRGITALIRSGASYVTAQAVPLGILFGGCVYLGSTSARVLCVAACIVVGMGIAAIDGWQRTLRRWAPGIRTLSRNPIIIAPVILVAWAAGSWVARDDDPEFLFRSYLPVHLAAMVAVSTVMFLPAVFGPAKGSYRRFLSARPMRVLGPLTFGIYLWHYPIIRWTAERVDLPLAVLWTWVVLASPVLALITYRAVEEPMERVRHRYFGRTSAPAPAPATERSPA
jgi:peptidoglycan/LPS O-acetylase OafA/YrhL